MQYLVGIVLSFFLLFLLVMKRGKSSADRVLMAWMAVIGVHQVLFYLSNFGIGYQFPHLLGLAIPFPLLHGVLLLFYVTALTKGRIPGWKQALPHFLPFLLLILLAVPFFRLSGEEKIRVFEQEGAGYEWFQAIQFVAVTVSGWGYAIWSLLTIRRHRRKVEAQTAGSTRELQWLQLLSVALGGIWVLVLFFDDNLIFTGVACLVLFIGYYGISRVPIFPSGQLVPVAAMEEAPAVQLEKEITAPRYTKSGLTEAEADRLHDRLSALMAREALFKNSELKLTDLAKVLDTHPNYLSQVINEREGKNFYAYLNSLRVEEFIRLAARPENKRFTILALAFDCGFNSKSTFNKYFRSMTGENPSEYVEKLAD